MFLKFVCFVLFISPLMGAALPEKKGVIEECQEQLTGKDCLKKGVLRKLQGLRHKKDVSDDDKAIALTLIEQVVIGQRFIPWQRAFWYRAWYELVSANKKDEVVETVIKTYQTFIGKAEKLFESDLSIFRYLLKTVKTPAMVGELTPCVRKMLELRHFDTNSHLGGLLLLIKYGAAEQKLAAIDEALKVIGQQSNMTTNGWCFLKEALTQAKGKPDELKALVESILRLTDVDKPNLSVRSYTAILPYATVSQKKDVLKASWVIYEWKIAAETEMSSEDLQYFHKIESNTHEPEIRDAFHGLLTTVKEKGVMPKKDGLLW